MNLTMTVNQITTSCAELTLLENGILEVQVLEGAELGLEETMEAVQAARELAQGQPCPILIDARKATSFTPESRAYMADPETTTFRQAEAIIVDSLPLKLIANFYLNFHRPEHPVKIFNNREKAINWLANFVPFNH